MTPSGTILIKRRKIGKGDTVMKKTVIILSAIFSLVACNKEPEPASQISAPAFQKYTYNITINRADTKAVKSGWEDGDVVCVFFSNVAAPKYLKFTYNQSEWTKTQYNGAEARDFDFPGDGTMTAVYLPYGKDAVVIADGESFKFDKTYTSYYMRAEKSTFKLEGTTVSGTLDMSAPEGFVQLAMPATNYFRTTGAITSSLFPLTLSRPMVRCTRTKATSMPPSRGTFTAATSISAAFWPLKPMVRKSLTSSLS